MVRCVIKDNSILFSSSSSSNTVTMKRKRRRRSLRRTYSVRVCVFVWGKIDVSFVETHAIWLQAWRFVNWKILELPDKGEMNVRAVYAITCRSCSVHVRRESVWGNCNWLPPQGAAGTGCISFLTASTECKEESERDGDHGCNDSLVLVALSHAQRVLLNDGVNVWTNSQTVGTSRFQEEMGNDLKWFWRWGCHILSFLFPCFPNVSVFAVFVYHTDAEYDAPSLIVCLHVGIERFPPFASFTRFLPLLIQLQDDSNSVSLFCETANTYTNTHTRSPFDLRLFECRKRGFTSGGKYRHQTVCLLLPSFWMKSEIGQATRTVTDSWITSSAVHVDLWIMTVRECSGRWEGPRTSNQRGDEWIGRGVSEGKGRAIVKGFRRESVLSVMSQRQIHLLFQPKEKDWLPMSWCNGAEDTVK